MKVGDKVVCIKCVNHIDWKCDIFNYTVGRIYEVLWITNGFVNVECDSSKFLTFDFAISRTNLGYIFEDYFIDIKKNRKLKLEKINESSYEGYLHKELW